MIITMTDRRKEIAELFRKEKYQELYKFNIQIAGDTKAGDCGAYVLSTIGFPSTPQTIEVLRDCWKLEEPQAGIIFYGFRSGRKFDVRHYGIYDGKRVKSKWERGPLFEHDIIDVPDYFGDAAMFRPKDPEILGILQQAMVGE